MIFIRKSIGVLIVLLLSLISLVYAAHLVIITNDSTTYYLSEDISYVFNITVNNTDLETTSNISEVNITIPLTFTYLPDSNGTNAGSHTFSSTNNVMSYSSSGLVMNLTFKNFYFNATVNNPGNYNFSVATSNATNTYYNNITIIVNDTTAPFIDYVYPTAYFPNLSSTSISINLSANDSSVIDTFRVYLFNTSGLMNNTNFTAVGGQNSSVYITYFSLPEGRYFVNASVNDTFGNINGSSFTNSFLLDTTRPNITLDLPVDGGASSSTAYNFTFNVTDNNLIANCSVIMGGVRINTIGMINNSAGGFSGVYNSSIAVGGYYWSINCTDFAGNTYNTSSRTLTVDAPSSSSGSSGGGGGGGGGGDSSTTLPGAIKSETRAVSKLTPGVDSIIRFVEPELGVKSIQINVNTASSAIIISVRKFDLLPAYVNIQMNSSKNNIVYKYFEINKTNLLNENINDVLIEVEVNKSFLLSNNYDPKNVIVQRYIPNLGWSELETSLSLDNITYYRYTAKSPGFSLFATTVTTNSEILETALAVEENTTIEKNQSVGPELISLPSAGKANLWWIWLIVVIILIGGGVFAYFFYTKNKGRKDWAKQ